MKLDNFKLSISLPIIMCTMLAASLAFSSTAYASKPYTHDGFFLRLSGGLAIANTAPSTSSDAAEFGLGIDMNHAIGYALTERLILHGTVWGWRVSIPGTETINTSLTTTENITIHEIVSLIMFGVGATSYFGDNWYGSLSIGAADMSVALDSDTPAEPKMGFGLDVALGKEWWIRNNWAIGAAAAVGLHTLPTDISDLSFSGLNFGLRFSATYN